MVIFASTVVLAFAVLQTAPSASVSSPMAQCRQIGCAREMTLALPHALRKGETAWLLVKVGAIGRDQIQITTQDGRPLGTISSFGIRSGKAAGTYTVRPLENEADVFELTSSDGKNACLFETLTTDLSSIPGKSEVVFKKYGDNYVLSQIYEAGSKVGAMSVRTLAERQHSKKSGIPTREAVETTKTP